MNLTEEKRELNNFLLRMYNSTNDENEKNRYLQELFNYNIDLVSYVIYHEFPNKGINYIEEGLTGLLIAIKNYKMDSINSFEEFILSNIKEQIGISTNKGKQKKR